MAEFQRQSSLTKEDKDQLKTNMITKLAHTDAHFKHQQIGEPDIAIEEKCDIASRLLEKSGVLFLERFSKYMTLEDVAYFSDEEDYQIQFYVNAIKERSNVNKNQKVIKNRRYQALQELMQQGDYFSDEEMQRRDPLLFEQMIGQHETEDEKQAREVDKTDMRFSSILLKYMDIQQTKECYNKMKEREEEQEEEEEESDESDEEDEENQVSQTQHREPNLKSSETKLDDGEKEDGISAEAQSQLRGEFLRIMQERFLSGEDQQFDYSKVDYNADYDSLAILNQDAEDKYFEYEDSPSQSCNSEMETGQ